MEVEDNAVCLFDGKTRISLLATTGAGIDLPVEVVLKTENETIRIINDTVLINDKQVDFKEDAKVFGKACYGVGHTPLIADFYDCIESGRPFQLNGAEASKVVRMILACYESKGKRISID